MFVWLARRGRRDLGEAQLIGTIGEMVAHGHDGRAGLAVPKFELAEILPSDIGEHGQPIFNRAGLPIMAGEIKVQCLFIRRIAHQQFEHTDQFCAFLIDGGCIKIIDLHKALRPNGMGQGAAVFAKLSSTQGGDIFNASHLCAPHIGAELLVAKHSQPFFEAQLEPVTAGDTIAGPIMEIFMGDDGFDPFEIAVQCGFGTGQNCGGIEYI